MGRLSPELTVLSFSIAYKKHCKHILANFQMSESEEDFSPNAHFPLETFLSPVLWFFCPSSFLSYCCWHHVPGREGVTKDSSRPAMGKQLPNRPLFGLIKTTIQTGKVCSTWITSCTGTGRDSVMCSTTLKQKHDPNVNTRMGNRQQFSFTEQTFGSNVLKATLWSPALTWTLALSSAALGEHVTGLHFNKYRWSSLWLSGTETKPTLLSMKQDLQQIDEKRKNTFYFWSGPRGFEVTLLPPDKEPTIPPAAKETSVKCWLHWINSKIPTSFTVNKTWGHKSVL